MKVAKFCLTLWPHGLYSPWNSPGQNTGIGSILPPPEDLTNPGIEPRPPALQEDSLPAELPGKPKNTGRGSLFLLQQIFLIHKLNCGLLHCRWILYQLSYQGTDMKQDCPKQRNIIITLHRPDIKWSDSKCFEQIISPAYLLQETTHSDRNNLNYSDHNK